jgi:hypothetical protein
MAVAVSIGVTLRYSLFLVALVVAAPPSVHAQTLVEPERQTAVALDATAVDGGNVPATRMRPNGWMFVPGIAMFGGSYVAAAVIAGMYETGVLAIPFAGPFLFMGTDTFRTGGDGDGTSEPHWFAYLLGTLWGVAQVAGATLVVLAVAFQEEVPVRARRQAELSLTPWLVPDRTGGSGGFSLAMRY